MARKNRKPISERVKSLIARHGGNAEQALTDVLSAHDRVSDRLEAQRESAGTGSQDAELRAENERLQEELDRVSATIPATGTVVLSAEDATRWKAFVQLGKKPEEITAIITKVGELEGKISTGERNTSIAEAATLAGYKPSVLTDIANRAGAELHIELRDVTEKVDGKDVKKQVPYVRKRADDKATLEPLTALIERDCKDYLPSLKAADADPSGRPVNTGITPFPVQAAAGGPAPSTGDTVTDHINRTNAARAGRSNPLFPGRQVAAAK